jgi:uncharacterized membrane protein YfcA
VQPNAVVVTFEPGSFVCVVEAFIAKKEAILDQQTAGSGRWWEAATLLLAINSVVFGFLFASNEHLGWAVAVGFVPGVLLLAGLGMRNSQRMGATILITVGSAAAAIAWWVVYTVVLALVIVMGGFWSGKIGPKRTKPEVAVA